VLEEAISASEEHTPLTTFIRIYEKKELDLSIGDPSSSTLGFVHLGGNVLDAMSG